MIEFEDISQELKDGLQTIADTDEFKTLNPETLYNGIRNSTGTNEKLAEFYDVEVQLVKKIKDINKD